MNYHYLKFFTITFAFLATLLPVWPESALELTVNLPHLKVNPYHNPYVAIWVETPEGKQVKTIALWVKEYEWFKDIRQWWRKTGRNLGSSIDAISSATRKWGTYTVTWDGSDTEGEYLPPGNYILNLEASREEGDRDYFRQTINTRTSETIVIQGNHEFGQIIIKTFNTKEHIS